MKPTHEEYDERVYACLQLLRQGQRDGAIKRTVAEQYGISPRSVERYLRRARNQLRREIGRPQEEIQCDIWAMASGVIANPDSSDRDKINAAKLLVDMLGLHGLPAVMQAKSEGPRVIKFEIVPSGTDEPPPDNADQALPETG